MRVSRNGKVSLPAEVRRRWGTQEVRVLDLGDRVVVRPALTGEPWDRLTGRYADQGPTSAESHAQDLADEVAAEGRRTTS